MITRFVSLPLEKFVVDTESRTIHGVAVPYGKQGNGFRFEKGALTYGDLGKVRLNVEHERSRTVGNATAVKDSTSGLAMSFRVLPTHAGDDALTLAAEGLLDSLSVEVEFDEAADVVPDPRHKGGGLIRRAELRGVALTGDPAFRDARITRVAMSTEEGEGIMPEFDITGRVDLTEVTAPEDTPAADGVEASAPPATTNFTQAPAPAPVPFINPVRPVALTQVNEVPYRFNRVGTLVPGTADFGIDLVRAAQNNRPDSPEYKRVMEFMRGQFTVSAADVNELSPTINQPRYIDEREFTYPLWNAVNRGAPPNGIQPFTYPVFSTASGMLATHVENTEPTSGTYVTAAHATITPAAISGKVTISRETWDLGGTPGLSDILWRRIMRDWFQYLEALVVTTLAAAGSSSLATFTAGGGNGAPNATTKTTLLAQLQKALAATQYTRGGAFYTDIFAHQGLFDGLIMAQDTTGRPVLPILQPSNANGTTAGRFTSVDFAGVPVVPSWALGAQTATATGTSYLLDRSSVDGYATAPNRLTFDQTDVAKVHIGVWGYGAAAVNDVNGVRYIAYQNLT